MKVVNTSNTDFKHRLFPTRAMQAQSPSLRCGVEGDGEEEGEGGMC